MRVGFNLLYLLPGIVGGTETYARQLLLALAAEALDDEFVAFVGREAADWPLPDRVRRRVLPVPVTRRALRLAYEQLLLPGEVRRERVDVLHSMGYLGPLRAPCPHIVTVHDANFVGLGSHMPAARRVALRLAVRAVARACDRVVTDSASSREALGSHGVSGGTPCDVVPLGPSFEAAAYDAARANAGAARGGRPYLLALSSLSGHKNIAGLLRAFQRIASQCEHRVVVAGHLPDPAGYRSLAQDLGLADRVDFLGYVSDERLLAAMAGADLFVMPSFYEGFGFPVLDAQLLGVPVACAERGALPEVAGAGAAYFDPGDEQGMADAVLPLLADRGARELLAAGGRANAARFSWARTARTMRESYRNVASGR
jgi:glycosyltransferase involved in cell wall biosynthesis